MSLDDAIAMIVLDMFEHDAHAFIGWALAPEYCRKVDADESGNLVLDYLYLEKDGYFGYPSEKDVVTKKFFDRMDE